MRPRDFLPSRSFLIETSWAPDVAAVELKKRIGARRLFGGGDLPFAGTAESPNEFRFSRTIAYRNSFLPVIHAVVEPSQGDGARVRVTMRLHLFVMAFMAVWMTGATIGSLVGAVGMLVNGQPAALLALAFPLAGVAMVMFGFAPEAQKAEHALREIFAGAPPRPQVGAYR